MRASRPIRFAGVLLSLLAAAVAVAAAAPARPLPFDKAEYSARRTRLMEKIPDGIAVVWGSLAGKQSNEITYLCGIEIPRAVLIVDGLRKQSHLFYTTTENFLKGEGLSPDLARDPLWATGVERHYPADQLSSMLGRLAGPAAAIYTPFRSEEAARDVATLDPWDGRLTRELQFVRLLRERFPLAEIRDLSEILWDLRRIKTPAEIEVQREAGKIGVQAMIEVMKGAKPGQPEYELSSLFEYACQRRGCRETAFPVIISSAENHPYLHYSRHDRILADGDFLVVDAGPELRDYDIDITISFPVNGKFTPRQREIYEACLAASEACLALYKPGVSGLEIGTKAAETLRARGADLSKDAFSLLRYFFKEGGLTHFVGLATHDAGGRDLDPKAPLKPGTVFASDVFAVFPGENLGVRVENTVLITEKGSENLSAGIPRTVAEIEALMKGRK